MNLIKRIKNLYNLSEIELPKKDKELITNILTQEKPRMAQIISMRDPVKEILKNEL